MKHNSSFVSATAQATAAVTLVAALIIALLQAPTSSANDNTIKKMKEDRDKIAELKEEICKDKISSRSECFKAYLETVKVQEAPELLALSVAITDMYARDRMQWEEKEIPFRFSQIENWFLAIEKVDTSKLTKPADQLAMTRAKQKMMAKSREELKTLYEILSTEKNKDVDQQKQKYRDLLQHYQKLNEQKFVFPKT